VKIAEGTKIEHQPVRHLFGALRRKTYVGPQAAELDAVGPLGGDW
jgi:hypothetical protein